MNEQATFVNLRAATYTARRSCAIRTEQHSEFSEDAEKGQGDSLYLVVGSITIK